MSTSIFPTVNLKATGANIVRLRKAKGLSVRDLQAYFGFEQPQAIYKWQWGESLPSVDNLYALSKILNTPMDRILVGDDQDFFMCTSFIYIDLLGCVRHECCYYLKFPISSII